MRNYFMFAVCLSLAGCMSEVAASEVEGNAQEVKLCTMDFESECEKYGSYSETTTPTSSGVRVHGTCEWPNGTTTSCDNDIRYSNTPGTAQ